MIDQLLLLSGGDIPFPQLRLSVHVPTLKQIAMMGEQNFFSACQLLRFSKENLSPQDRINLISYSNFDIIMSILRDKKPQAQLQKYNVIFVLTLLFPDTTIHFDKDGITFEKDKVDDKYVLNDENYDKFRQILTQILCLGKQDDQEYKAAGKDAQRIIDKIKQGRAKRAKQQPKRERQPSVLARYVSILATGQQKDMNELLNYTIYQLYDEFKRYQLKQEYDLYISQKLAGAQNVQPVDNWMKDIYEDTNNDDFAKFAKNHHS